jgi:pyruvate kinase
MHRGHKSALLFQLQSQSCGVRKTKIICTLGPASESAKTIEQMIRAGTDIFRLNMSHAKHDWVREVVSRVRAIAKRLGQGTALMMDTQGPAIRTGELDDEMPVGVGEIVELTVGRAKPRESKSTSVNYKRLPEDVKVGNTVLVDNGVMRLKVIAKARQRLRCQALTQGTLSSRRHINLPGVRVRIPPLTAKDLDDVALGAELGVDFVALSFAHQREDIEQLRRELSRLKSSASVIAKIETQSAVEQIDDMIEAADAVLIARGDLGIEMPMEELPITQRKIVKRCIRAGKPVIVATHLLESMVDNPVPTRAEVTDVANAVFEQSDALMLTGETSSGRYPVDCVKVLDRVALRIERSGGAGYASEAQLEDARQKTVMSAVVLANSLRNSKLIVFTRHGTMARYVANLRPQRSPIFAFTPSEHVYRQLALCWGTHPVLLPFRDDPNSTIAAAERYLCRARLTKSGENLIILTDVHARGAMFDCVQVREARDADEQESDERPAGESMMD